MMTSRGFPGDSVGEEAVCNAGNTGDAGSIPGWGRSPGGGYGKPLQHSCPENPRDRGAWWATVHGVSKSQTWNQPSTHRCMMTSRPRKKKKVLNTVSQTFFQKTRAVELQFRNFLTQNVFSSFLTPFLSFFFDFSFFLSFFWCFKVYIFDGLELHSPEWLLSQRKLRFYYILCD